MRRWLALSLAVACGDSDPATRDGGSGRVDAGPRRDAGAFDGGRDAATADRGLDATMGDGGSDAMVGDGGCAISFSCRDGGTCDGVGAPCERNPDCVSGICLMSGEERWCSALCASPSDCPAGFECREVAASRLCAPECL